MALLAISMHMLGIAFAKVQSTAEGRFLKQLLWASWWLQLSLVVHESQIWICYNSIGRSAASKIS